MAASDWRINAPFAEPNRSSTQPELVWSMATSEMDRDARLELILDRLYEEFPDATISLTYSNRLELLIAVMLSAQCTDDRVNQETPALFDRYGSVEAFAEADQSELAEQIGSITYPNSKAEYIRTSCQLIRDEYEGTIPDSMEELTKLPGVGRKTANVVLQHGHDIREGVVVDTHVMRLSKRLSLTDARSRDAIERSLMELVPKEHWQEYTHLMINHGRSTCTAINPDCESCILEDLCPSAKTRAEVDLASGEPWD